MAAELDGTIVALQVEEGNKPGQPIGSYRRHIVFLPAKAPVGKEVKVKLTDTGRKDRNERAIYRGVPAPPEEVFRYKDNGDSTLTISLVTRDWLGSETVGVEEKRPFALRESAPQSRRSPSLHWGTDLASSLVEETEVLDFFQEVEYLTSGRIDWKRTGQRRTETGSSIMHPLIEILVRGCEWDNKKLSAVWEDSWRVNVRACYDPKSVAIETFSEYALTWGEFPAWFRAEQEVLYPLCSCGRQRRDVKAVNDGYGKCELCRVEENCERCGKQTKVAAINGHLVCDNCKPYEETEQLIVKSLSMTEKERIATEAKKLLAGQAMLGSDGEVVLRATADHITSDWRKDSFLRKCVGYGWHYFCDEGIYGTKLASAALQILQFLPQASGNGLVEMVMWLVGGPKPWDSDRDFYLRTQVNGESGVTPAITEDQLKQLKIAEFLRGSEANRIAALTGYQNLVSKLGGDADEMKAVAEILQDERQDYAKALVELRKAGVEKIKKEDKKDDGTGSLAGSIAALRKQWGAH